MLNIHANNSVMKINPTITIDSNEMDDHSVFTSFNTPLNPDAPDLSDDQKIEVIEKHFRAIMHTLGLDLTDDSLSGTPKRVAKMYVKEIFSGLNEKNRPSSKLFENPYQYGEMLIEKDITFYSTCEHHFVPIYGKVHVAYMSSGKVIGLSKINRLVQFFAKRPQVQERLTVQIGEELKKVLETEHVALVIEADHMCVASRGVQDVNSSTITSFYSGNFKVNQSTKNEFLGFIKK